MGAVLVAEPFAELLDYIVRDLVITDGQKDVDLNASADEDATVIDAQKRQFAANAVEQARALLPAFRTVDREDRIEFVKVGLDGAPRRTRRIARLGSDHDDRLSDERHFLFREQQFV